MGNPFRSILRARFSPITARPITPTWRFSPDCSDTHSPFQAIDLWDLDSRKLCLLGFNSGEQSVVRLDERGDAFVLELTGDSGDFYPCGGQFVHMLMGEVQIPIDRAGHGAVIEEGLNRLAWHGVDRLRTDQGVDIERVGIVRVLGASAGPERPLWVSA